MITVAHAHAHAHAHALTLTLTVIITSRDHVFTQVVFGDVNLAEDQVQGKYAGEPGAGGWPTIRAYNKETGYEGVFAGDWKESNSLDGAMCDVFGKVPRARPSRAMRNDGSLQYARRPSPSPPEPRP